MLSSNAAYLRWFLANAAASGSETLVIVILTAWSLTVIPESALYERVSVLGQFRGC